jgi:hypothetical protein
MDNHGRSAQVPCVLRIRGRRRLPRQAARGNFCSAYGPKSGEPVRRRQREEI